MVPLMFDIWIIGMLVMVFVRWKAHKNRTPDPDAPKTSFDEEIKTEFKAIVFWPYYIFKD